MSHEYWAINKQHKHPKVHFHEYLGYGEPRENKSHDTRLDSEAETEADAFSMRRNFRRMAQRMRDHDS